MWTIQWSTNNNAHSVVPHDHDPPEMPCILHPRDFERWLDREETEQLPLDLLRRLDSEEVGMHEADPKVGNVSNNGPELMMKAAEASENGELPL